MAADSLIIEPLTKLNNIRKSMRDVTERINRLKASAKKKSAIAFLITLGVSLLLAALASGGDDLFKEYFFIIFCSVTPVVMIFIFAWTNAGRKKLQEEYDVLSSYEKQVVREYQRYEQVQKYEFTLAERTEVNARLFKAQEQLQIVRAFCDLFAAFGVTNTTGVLTPAQNTVNTLESQLQTICKTITDLECSIHTV